jgi:hypothetical protein
VLFKKILKNIKKNLTNYKNKNYLCTTIRNKILYGVLPYYQWQRENVSMVNYSSNSNGILLRFGVQVFLGNSNKPQAN